MKKYIILGICLLLIVILAAWLRIVLPYDAVFGSGEVRFLTVDAYAHMRMADWCYDNFPSVMKYDAYLTYPDGAVIGARPMLSFIIAAIAKGTGLTVDVVGAWLPPILFILMLIPIFIICYLLFNKWIGIIGCFLVTIMPGELIGRTQLGMADHDALELFLMMLVLMFFILAIKKNWLYSIGAGISLGLYNLNWIGAPTFTLILLIYLIIQSVIYHFRKQANNKLYLTALITFGLGFVGYITPVGMRQFLLTYTILYIVAMMLPIIIILLTKGLQRFKPYYYPISLVGLVILVLGSIYVYKPILIKWMIDSFVGAFVPQSSGLGMTISEMMPLLYYRGVFSFDTAWAYYGMCAITGLIGLGWLYYKHWNKPESLLFAIWATFTLILTILQRRYGYYAAVSLGILTGYIIWTVYSKVSIKRLSRQQRKRGSSSIRYEGAIISGLIILFVIVAPVFLGGKATASVTPYKLPNSWSEGLHWLDNNTPKLLETNGQIPKGTSREGLVPINSAYKEIDGYGIVSWWDYGYWIIREAKRPAIVHPGGGWLLWTSAFLLCKENDTYLQEYVERFKPRYIIIDYQMVTGKFYAIPEIARSGLGANIDDVIKQIGGYTDKDIPDTLIMKLYYTGKFDSWGQVWESKEQYNGQPEVKIFEYKDYEDSI